MLCIRQPNRRESGLVSRESRFEWGMLEAARFEFEFEFG